MKKYAFLFILLLLIPVYIYATDGVNTVEHPAKVNSVATPDKVCGVSGLAGGGGEETLRPNGSGYSAWDASAGDYWDCVGDENGFQPFTFEVNKEGSRLQSYIS